MDTAPHRIVICFDYKSRKIHNKTDLDKKLPVIFWESPEHFSRPNKLLFMLNIKRFVNRHKLKRDSVDGLAK